MYAHAHTNYLLTAPGDRFEQRLEADEHEHGVHKARIVEDGVQLRGHRPSATAAALTSAAAAAAA